MKLKRYHTPVLLKEVIGFLKVRENEKYIDATLGGGGHTKEILKLKGRVLGIDVDIDAIKHCRNKFNKNKNISIEKGNFRDIERIAHLKGFEKVSGIIFDLGVSSYQIDEPSRGFSFLKEGPLDMRMDKDLSVKAADLLKILKKGDLYEIFNNLGQENNAWSISSAIVSARRIDEIKTTTDLGRIIARAYKIREERLTDFKKNEIFKRVFQALRMAVNNELENLEEGLNKSINLLKHKGKIVVISFHSLEDRITKQVFKDFEEKNMGKIITKKPVLPSFNEIKINPRSASAKLRVFEKN